MADDQPLLHTNCHVVVTIPEVSEDGLWREFSPPSLDFPVHEGLSWVPNGDPVNSIGGGRKFQWGTATFGRGVDAASKIYLWVKACQEEDATAQKKEITAEVKDQDGATTLQTWTFHGSLPQGWNPGTYSADGSGILMETLTVKFDSAEMTPGG